MLDNFAQRQYNSILLISVPGCSAVGSVLGSGPRGREFKSRHSDQKSTGFDKKPVDLFFVCRMRLSSSEIGGLCIHFVFFLNTILIKFKYFPPPASMALRSPIAYAFSCLSQSAHTSSLDSIWLTSMISAFRLRRTISNQ